MLKRQGAFTLIELMIVIVIMAILAGILFAAFANAESRAKGKNTEALMLKIHMALENFKGENGNYPEQTTLINSANATSEDLKLDTDIFDIDIAVAWPYFEDVEISEEHRVVESGDNYYLIDAWKNPLRYFNDSTNGNSEAKEGFEGTYELRSYGADGKYSGKDDIVSYGAEISIKQ